MLPPPSAEQAVIIDAIKNGNSVICDAVAGSGKTTTVLLLAQQLPDKKILQITYNRMLKEEVRKKISQHVLTNLIVHNYHSLCVRCYDPKAYTDAPMEKVITQGTSPNRRIAFDILVIDEVQDMTDLLYRFTRKVISDMSDSCLMVLMGDRYQSVYDFKGADFRYLTLGHRLWPNIRRVEHLCLSISYRLTKHIAGFINNSVIGSKRIISQKDGQKVQYISSPSSFWYLCTTAIIKRYLTCGYKYSDIFILAPSVRVANRKHPIARIENELVKEDIPVYVSADMEHALDEKVIQNKVVITTFHQAKGRERDLVFVCRFDDGYYEWNARDSSREECTSAMYVAITRAKRQLVLLADIDTPILPFLRPMSEKHVNIHGTLGRQRHSRTTDNARSPYTTVTDLLAFIPEKTIIALDGLVNKLIMHHSKGDIDIELTKMIETDYRGAYSKAIDKDSKLHEAVATINGNAIPLFWECRHKPNYLAAIPAHLGQKNPKTIEETLRMCVEYASEIYDFSYKQIDRYDWLRAEDIDKMVEIIHQYLRDDSAIEVDIWHRFKLPPRDIFLKGRIDAISDDTLWELKCVSELTLDHKLQLILYMTLCINKKQKIREHIAAGMTREDIVKKVPAIDILLKVEKYKLLNMRTDEVIEIVPDIGIITKIFELLVESKYKPIDKVDDEVFVANVLRG